MMELALWMHMLTLNLHLTKGCFELNNTEPAVIGYDSVSDT